MMLKKAFAPALKRHWGLIVAILMITAVSDWRHNQQVSILGLLVALLAALLVLSLAAVPVEYHKLRKSR